MTDTSQDLATIPVVDVSDVGLTATPLQQAMRLARTHGPVFRRRLHDTDRLFVCSPDLVAELSDEDRFTKHVGPALENVREFTADGLFTAYNDEPNWAKAHDILLPAFALGSLRAYHPAMVTAARRLIDAWDGHLRRGSAVDVAEDMTRMTLDTIGLAGFGYDFESFARREPHPFVGAMVRCLEWSMNRLGRAPGADHSAEDAAFRDDAGYLAAVVDEVIATRRASGERRTDDLLGLMLGAPHPADGTLLDAANIRSQVITFLIAGHETTSGALSFALYHLLRNPVALRLAQREADELWGDTEDPEPSFEDVGRLRWTRQVLNEALRLWPTAAAFNREPRQDTLLGGRYRLRAGEGVTVLTPMLHRDAAVWGDNPELFDPTRFDPEAEAARPPHAYKPFGTGERACIGRQFALHEATMLLGLLVHRYRLTGDSGYRLKIKETLTLKPEGFTLTLARRTTRHRTPPPAAPAASVPTGPSRVRPGTGLLVLHGSNYGTCRELAQALAERATALGCEARTAPLDAYAGQLPAGPPVVIVAASYNGRPTDDAAAFARWAEQAADGAAKGVRYAVLGVGDRNWAATYQRVPTLLDERLAALGGTRLLPRAEADASGDLTGAVDEFTGALCRTLLEHHGDPATTGAPEQAADQPAYTVTELTGPPLGALAARHGVTPMTVTEAYDLTAPGHPRVKRFLRLALPEGVNYRTGDHLAVLPVNDSRSVDRAARLFGVHPDTLLSIQPRRPGRQSLPVDRPLTARELLTHHLELHRRPTARQTAALAERNPCPPERAALRALSAEDPRTLLELIEDHPALHGTLGAAALVELLPPMRLRQYSISSSPAVDARHIDLMVSLPTDRTATGPGHLARLRPGDTLLARLQPCREAFRIDHRRPHPVVMVAAGTGLAPFRGAIADRTALLATGTELAPALLYFGCDDPEADYLHTTELHAAQEVGAVSLRPAFSQRPGPDGPFVQHRMAAEGAELWSLLKAGASVYVCGDGARMAPGVRAALRDLYTRQTGAPARHADEWLRQLTDEGRYVEDVYAG
ncbi:bifunctional cytochrome P450/NADPH--P450 reductase [Streptomyces orinoci]|uniref:Bifunctional cytochrome P450/NADPH--P450 reductase n=1 Tax=Streptomyces orinoci TaxID=67339 RepID=A0ABV3JRX2_STRON|nr:cytochrome P450 [Streptomyces orinoci]